jgi:hypothetical protein
MIPEDEVPMLDTDLDYLPDAGDDEEDLHCEFWFEGQD